VTYEKVMKTRQEPSERRRGLERKGAITIKKLKKMAKVLSFGGKPYAEQIQFAKDLLLLKKGNHHGRELGGKNRGQKKRGLGVSNGSQRKR